MAFEDTVPASTLSDTLDDVTDIEQYSRLQLTHEQRRTDDGFVVSSERLPNCVPTPIARKALTSWIWDYGHPISRPNDQGDYIRHWLCKICYADMLRVPTARVTMKTKFMMPCNPTTRPARHMGKHGYDEAGNRLNSAKKRKQDTLGECIDKQQRLHDTVFDRKGWQISYTTWIACSGVSLRQASQPELYNLLTFHNPKIEQLVPRNDHTTPRRWIMESYHAARSRVIQSLKSATSRITISFDGWKANNEILDVLGVVAYYLNSDYKLQTIVLGMRDTMGSHTGTNIADHLVDVLSDFEIEGHQVAYYAADNATNNDTALVALNAHVTVDPTAQRLRCMGHILNLVCNAILYGVDEDALEDASQTARESNSCITTNFDTTLRNGSEEVKLLAWRKKGPVGKLHNTVVHIKANNQRRELFERKQREIIDVAGDEPVTSKIYRAVINGGIRWNSTYLMIERALLLKDAISLYQSSDESNCDRDDLLDKQDWLQLSELHALLKPMYRALLHVQSTPDHLQQKHGALHEVLTTMDFLLSHLETAKAKETYTNAVHYRTSVNLGWIKLDQYYARTDANPAYIMAVFLHPHYRQHWFEAHWSKVDCNAATAVVEKAYAAAKKRYNTLVPRRTPPVLVCKEMDDYAAHCNVSRRAHMDDDLYRWRHEEQAHPEVNPLAWWQANHQNYPILKHLAFDLLATPASTAADERLFSMAGNVVNEHRPHTQAELAQAVQCLRSWHQAGLV